MTAKDARVEAVARLRYEDGEEAQLELREGRFWITSSGALPGGSRTPEQALESAPPRPRASQLCGLDACAHSVHAGGDRTRPSFACRGLERPETLHVEVTGDSAVVTIPGGHSVKLKREGGVWRVDDFD